MFKVSLSVTTTEPDPLTALRSRISVLTFKPIIRETSYLNPRYFTRKKATSYGVTGWVRNTTNNKVA